MQMYYNFSHFAQNVIIVKWPIGRLGPAIKNREGTTEKCKPVQDSRVVYAYHEKKKKKNDGLL